MVSYNKPVNQYSEKEINEIAAIFHKWHIMFSGTEGYKVAEVTRGGLIRRNYLPKPSKPGM
jgi:predicted flavoprotein YhiN